MSGQDELGSFALKIESLLNQKQAARWAMSAPWFLGRMGLAIEAATGEKVTLAISPISRGGCRSGGLSVDGDCRPCCRCPDGVVATSQCDIDVNPVPGNRLCTSHTASVATSIHRIGHHASLFLRLPPHDGGARAQSQAKVYCYNADSFLRQQPGAHA